MYSVVAVFFSGMNGKKDRLGPIWRKSMRGLIYILYIYHTLQDIRMSTEQAKPRAN